MELIGDDGEMTGDDDSPQRGSHSQPGRGIVCFDSKTTYEHLVALTGVNVL